MTGLLEAEGTAGGPASRRAPRRFRRRRVVGVLLAAVALLVAFLLVGHALVPDIGGLGALLDSFVPWLGALVPPLAVVALALRSRLGLIALLVPTVAWLGMFGPAFLPKGTGGTADLTVVSQNLQAANANPAGTVSSVLSTGADLVAVQEMTWEDGTTAVAALDARYPYHVREGTVGLWSRFPVSDEAPVDLGLGWRRALRAEVATPHGTVAVYVAHLASARPDQTAERDATLRRLADTVRRDDAHRLLLLGDLNTASTDRHLRQLTPPLREAQARAGTGLGFTWPAAFPLTRPDHVLYRGLTATEAGVRSTGSDHDAVTAGFTL